MKSKRVPISAFALFAALTIVIAGCTNPFAPRLSDIQNPINSLGDQRTIEGVFQNFRYSYLVKDTLIYGKLLAPDFTFIYRNYDLGIDNSWGRDEDMLSTTGLFQAAQSLDLIWNDIVTAVGDSLTQDIARGFNLTITFNPADIVRVQGRANFRLSRAASTDVWMIRRWRDESNF